MEAHASEPTPRAALREDLAKEYYAILGVVTSYDGWLLVVKGWSVTLSLASLGVGFQYKHYALFGLAAVTALGFWFLDGLMKGYEFRYYDRMREIEYTSYLLNAVVLNGEFGESKISAPRIDMTWGFKGYPVDDAGRPLHRPWLFGLRRDPKDPNDWRAAEPWRRTPQEIDKALRRRFWWMNVALPHAVAVVLGTALFIASLLNSPGLADLAP